jgi:hypothetical protein
MRSAPALAITVLTCAFLSCSSAFHVYETSGPKPEAVGRVNEHETELRHETSAQLLQVTISSPRFTRRFNVEVYHRSDTTAFYNGGFAGKGSFKGLLNGSMLRFILPKERQYYAGPVSGLIRPDLARYEYVVVRLRELLSGNLLCDQSDDVPGDLCGMWDQRLSVKGERIRKIILRSLADPIVIEADFGAFKQSFPFYQIKRVKISNSETGANIKLKLMEQRYGPVPEIKFTLPDLVGWESIDYFELK